MDGHLGHGGSGCPFLGPGDAKMCGTSGIKHTRLPLPACPLRLPPVWWEIKRGKRGEGKGEREEEKERQDKKNDADDAARG